MKVSVLSTKLESNWPTSPLVQKSIISFKHGNTENGFLLFAHNRRKQASLNKLKFQSISFKAKITQESRLKSMKLIKNRKSVVPNSFLFWIFSVKRKPKPTEYTRVGL